MGDRPMTCGFDIGLACATSFIANFWPRLASERAGQTCYLKVNALTERVH